MNIVMQIYLWGVLGVLVEFYLIGWALTWAGDHKAKRMNNNHYKWKMTSKHVLFALAVSSTSVVGFLTILLFAFAEGVLEDWTDELSHRTWAKTAKLQSFLFRPKFRIQLQRTASEPEQAKEVQ